MAIDPNAAGRTYGPTEGRWTSKDALLYAVGLGCGTDDLAFVTENTAGLSQVVLPTFPTVASMAEDRVTSTIGSGTWLEHVGDFDLAMLIHGGQGVELHAPLPVECSFVERGVVTGVYDKGSAAVITTETTATDRDTGAALYTTRSSVFIRGEGGWGGDRGPSPQAPPPARAPDRLVGYATHRDQGLVYRLSGDRNPLHSDPAFATRAGFERPILHGLCTYGIAGRALLKAVCGDDPARFVSMDARFAKPVLPGDELTVAIWLEDGTAEFRVERGDDVVLDRGHLRYRQ